jgi:hypothetical protein
MESESEYCDICGRECDGVHKVDNKKSVNEIERITNMLESYGEKTVDEVIRRIYENRRKREKNKS